MCIQNKMANFSMKLVSFFFFLIKETWSSHTSVILLHCIIAYVIKRVAAPNKKRERDKIKYRRDSCKSKKKRAKPK